ncbi:MAG: GTPase Era [Firmicutes bacterium ADurb.Bin356]|nr:MAG: GTPase Era [Firmicutes bacterium ADurb.Bin356]
MGFKSGFICIVGCPNAGKSTLLNSLVGEKIAIVSDKAQTTRSKITGILTRDDYQMVFLDTPGATVPNSRLGEYMQKTVFASLIGVDVILFVLDAINGMREKDEMLIERLKKTDIKKIGLINKLDAATPAQLNTAWAYLEKAGCFEKLLKISAKSGEGLRELEEVLYSYLEEGPKYYPDDMVTDMPERLLCAELVREKTLGLLREEVPHGIVVEVDKMGLRPDRKLYDIWATVYCERESHKPILIGKGGSMLRRIGEDSRKEMELMLGVSVNLQLYVKVREGWRDNIRALNELGFK